jgi:RNA polymerase sigma-70 factor, ECF subfamily
MQGMPETPKDADIVRRTLNGEVNAFELLLHRYKAHALRIIQRRVPTKDVEDVLQEVFIKAYRSLPGFEPDSHFKKWLSAIAVRACCDYWRSARSSRESPMSALSERHQEWLKGVISAASMESAARRARQKEAKEVLAWALDQMPWKDRMVVEMVHLEGLSGRDAANLLGWSVANVKVRAFRGRKRLRTLLFTRLKREEGPS